MTDGTRHSEVLRFWPQALAATLLVSVCPLGAVYALEAAGLVHPTFLSFVFGVLLSAGIAVLASAAWARFSGPSDMVFADLMLWGFFSRLRSEKSITEIIELLDRGADDPAIPTDIDSARRIHLLKKLAAALETNDPHTHGHSRRVARYSEMIGEALHLDPDEIDRIRTAAAVHDVGKVRVPQEILNKPGKLTDEEFATIKEHAAAGAAMVAAAGDPELTAIVRHHHERIDGRGYPDRLLGNEIPLGARIIAVADTFDAITSTRSYRVATHHSNALDVLKTEAEKQLDADAVHAFLACYSGRTSRIWWASLSTAPQRLLAGLVEWLAPGAAGVTSTLAAVGVAAALGTPLLAGPPAGSAAEAIAPALGPVASATRHQALEGWQPRGRTDPDAPSRAGRNQSDHRSEGGEQGTGSGNEGIGEDDPGSSTGDPGGVLDDVAEVPDQVSEALPDTNQMVGDVRKKGEEVLDELVDDLPIEGRDLPLP